MVRMQKKNTVFKLYTHEHSANGRKVLAVSQHLKLEPDIIRVNIYAGEGQQAAYLKVNPLGKIPTLVADDFILWESNAILQYMAETSGHFQLSSQDPQKRAKIASWLFWESAHWQPSISVVLAPVVGHRLLPNLMPAPSGEPDWRHQEFYRWITYLNSYLAQHDFLANNELSIADFSVAGMMTYFRFAKFPFSDFPALKNWYEGIESLDAWKESASTLWTVN